MESLIFRYFSNPSYEMHDTFSGSGDFDNYEILLATGEYTYSDRSLVINSGPWNSYLPLPVGMAHILRALCECRRITRDLTPIEIHAFEKVVYGKSTLIKWKSEIATSLNYALTLADKDCRDILGINFCDAYSTISGDRLPENATMSAIDNYDILCCIFGVARLSVTRDFCADHIINVYYNRSKNNFHVSLHNTNARISVPYIIYKDMKTQNTVYYTYNAQQNYSYSEEAVLEQLDYTRQFEMRNSNPYKKHIELSGSRSNLSNNTTNKAEHTPNSVSGNSPDTKRGS